MTYAPLGLTLALTAWLTVLEFRAVRRERQVTQPRWVRVVTIALATVALGVTLPRLFELLT